MQINPGSFEAIIPLVAGVWFTVIGFNTRLNNPKWNTIKKIRWLGPLVIVFAIFLFAKGSFENRPDLEVLSQQIKSKLNLPLLIDPDTRLDDIKPKGEKEIEYSLTLVNFSKGDPVLNQLVNNLEAAFRDNSCKDPNYIKFFNSGITVTMVYFTNDQNEALNMSIAPSDCK